MYEAVLTDIGMVPVINLYAYGTLAMVEAAHRSFIQRGQAGRRVLFRCVLSVERPEAGSLSCRGMAMDGRNRL